MIENLISFVIPCYRSERSIGFVLDEIIRIMELEKDYIYEIIAVNDGSPDQVFSVLKKRAQGNIRIKVIDLVKNMGKHAALMAGYHYASGKTIVCVDDDGQCPVDRLWDLLAPLQNGYDVSIAKYGSKSQSAFKNFGSKLNDFMTRILLEKPKDLQFGSFFAMNDYILQEIIKYDNPYPYLDGLLLRTTTKIANIPMPDRERINGTSGYTFKKMVSLWMNGFTAFSVKPLRIATVTGMICALIGFIFGVYTIMHKLVNPATPAGWSSTMAALLFIGGMIMLILGLIGEYIGRIYICINASPQYVIRETVNIKKDEESNKDGSKTFDS